MNYNKLGQQVISNFTLVISTYHFSLSHFFLILHTLVPHFSVFPKNFQIIITNPHISLFTIQIPLHIHFRWIIPVLNITFNAMHAVTLQITKSGIVIFHLECFLKRSPKHTCRDRNIVIQLIQPVMSKKICLGHNKVALVVCFTNPMLCDTIIAYLVKIVHYSMQASITPFRFMAQMKLTATTITHPHITCQH